MTDYNNGQIHGWNGGDCPVHPETVVNVWKRGSWIGSSKAGKFCWDHGNCVSDIIAFQVVKAYVEPKVIWVNEYAGNQLYAYDTEGQAKVWANSPGVRIAVKYVEVVDDKEAKDD